MYLIDTQLQVLEFYNQGEEVDAKETEADNKKKGWVKKFEKIKVGIFFVYEIIGEEEYSAGKSGSQPDSRVTRQKHSY